MKTKISILLFFTLLLTSFSYAQTTGGGETPDSLSFTFADTTQNLQVNGSIVVDSSLTVKDSVVMQDNLHVYEKLQLEKDAHLRKDVYVGNTLKVVGESYFNGNAFLNQKVFIPNLSELDDFESKYILFTKEDGLVEKKLVFDVLAEIYKSPCKTDANGDVPNPTWQNGLNKIFTPCPEVNVGIGTSTPTHKLHTIGNGYFTNTLQIDQNVAIGTQPSAFSMLKVKNPSASAGIEIDMSENTSAYQKLLFMQYTQDETELIKIQNTSTGQIPFVLESNGKLVISNETEKILQLDPNGILRARRIKVDTDTWADFVFDKNYKLMPLSEVEQYVVTENHLPNVPSAKEVIQNGVDLVEMNKILLQKVEELTLYIISQEKRLNQLASEVLLK